MKEVLDGEYISTDFEKHYRHNGGYQDIVFNRDGKNYRTTYIWFENDGIEWQDVYEAVEVVEAEKVIKYWKVKE
jgi:hypothetical protein